VCSPIVTTRMQEGCRDLSASGDVAINHEGFAIMTSTKALRNWIVTEFVFFVNIVAAAEGGFRGERYRRAPGVIIVSRRSLPRM